MFRSDASIWESNLEKLNIREKALNIVEKADYFTTKNEIALSFGNWSVKGFHFWEQIDACMHTKLVKASTRN